MMRRFQGFVAGVICSCIIFFSADGFSEGVLKTIEVAFNSANVVNNGLPANVDNLIYEGRTYIQLRALSDLFNKELEWDSGTNTIYIDEKGSPKLKGTYPSNGQNGFFPNYTYIGLKFTQNMKECTDPSQIILTAKSGERLYVSTIQPGNTEKDFLCLILRNTLKLDTDYTLSIPRNTLESVDGQKYNRDINIVFKTAFTVLKGLIRSSKDYSGMTISISNKKTSVTSDGNFMFTNIEGGKQTVKITSSDGKVYEKEITIQSGMVNEITLFTEFK